MLHHIHVNCDDNLRQPSTLQSKSMRLFKSLHKREAYNSHTDQLQQKQKRHCEIAFALADFDQPPDAHQFANPFGRKFPNPRTRTETCAKTNTYARARTQINTYMHTHTETAKHTIGFCFAKRDQPLHHRVAWCKTMKYWDNSRNILANSLNI